MTHKMMVETREEREERGHPVGMDVPYQAMGGLTGFSSLADGYMRLDPSGTGKYLCNHQSCTGLHGDNQSLAFNIRHEHNIHQSILFGFPGNIDHFIVINYCFLYAK